MLSPRTALAGGGRGQFLPHSHIDVFRHAVTSGVSAGFGRRCAALIYDSFLLLALLMIYTGVSLIFTPGHIAVTQDSAGVWWYVYRAGELAVIGGYYVLNWVHNGQTLGMLAWRLRAVGDGGQPMTFRSGVLRFVWGFLAWPPAALGVLWLYFDPYHAAIHDRLSRTRVLVIDRPG